MVKAAGIILLAGRKLTQIARCYGGRVANVWRRTWKRVPQAAARSSGRKWQA